MADNTKSEEIKREIAAGHTKEDIYKNYLAKGWSIQDIESGFTQHIEEDEKEDSQKRTVQIILVVATVLIGAGIFSFIAANWSGMDDITKVIVIVGSMLASYYAGYHIRENTPYQKTGNALLLLGNIIYGAGIFLIAQIFNIRANWPDGFIYWFLGTLGVAFAINWYPLFHFAAVVAIIALITYPVFILESFTGGRGSLYLGSSTFLIIIATAVTFAVGYYMKKKIPDELKEYY